jgi:hypothetical protein
MLNFLSRIFAKKIAGEGDDRVMDKGKVDNWKVIAVRSAAFGGTFAIVVVILLGILSWHKALPKPPRPWNTSAVVAKYDYTNIDPNNKTAFFWYTLENKTDIDYRLDVNSDVPVLVKHKGRQGLVPYDGINFDRPLFIPSKHRVVLAVHFRYPLFSEFKAGVNNKEGKDDDKIIHEFLNREMPNMDGFTLFDEENRYEIDLPKGW